MTNQCDEPGKECRNRFICFPLYKAKHGAGPEPCPEYRLDEEWNSKWV